MIEKAIDPRRSGISKSLATNPCERRGFYSEAVRDEQGNRLSFAMPEKVLFGRAIDAAHAFIVGRDRMGSEWHPDEAVLLGLQHAADTEASEDIDWQVFELQVRNAIALFMQQPDGIARMRPLYDGLKFQGANGRSLRTFVEGVGEVVGTPDYIQAGVVDVKTSSRAYNASKFYTSAEMPIYSLLYTAESGGDLPSFLAYQVYVRKAKPEWTWLEVPASSLHVELGKRYALRWAKGLATGDPDLFSFDASFCYDSNGVPCPFLNPIPDVGHSGCPIGLTVPVIEDQAA